MLIRKWFKSNDLTVIVTYATIHIHLYVSREHGYFVYDVACLYATHNLLLGEIRLITVTIDFMTISCFP